MKIKQEEVQPALPEARKQGRSQTLTPDDRTDERNRPTWGAERTASESAKATRWSRGTELEKTRSQDTSGDRF